MNLELLRTKIERMIDSGEIELIGEPPAGPSSDDLAVYRETKTGHYRVGDRYHLHCHSYRTEEAARAAVDFETAVSMVRRNLDVVRGHGGDAIPTATILEATGRINKVAADLYRLADDVERQIEEGGDTGFVPYSEMEGAQVETMEDGSRLVTFPSSKPKAEPTPEQLRATVLKAIKDREAIKAIDDSKAWNEWTDADRDRLNAARAEADRNLVDAIIHQSYHLRGWEARRAAVLYKDSIYTPWGDDPDSGQEAVLRIPLADIIHME